MNQNESLLDVVVLLYKWRKHILGASFLVAVVTALASLMMPNYYQASSLFYAASPDLADPMPLGNLTVKKEIYGTDSDLDRLFSIAKSSEITSFLLEKFDLYNHYEIKPDDPKAQYKLSLKLNKLYETQKTKYDAISLTVEDKDRLFATEMANAARVKIDEMAQNVIKSSQFKQIESYKASIASKEKMKTDLEAELTSIKAKYNIFSSEAQGEAYGMSLLTVEGKYLQSSAQADFLKGAKAPRDSIIKVQAQASGYKSQLEKLKTDIKSYNAGYPAVKSLERQIRDFSNQLNIDKERLSQLNSVYSSNISAIHVVEEASTPIVKSRPKRSIIVVGSAFLTFVLMSLWVIIKDQYNKNNWRDQFSNA